MKRIYSVLVENRAGVLSKVAGLFWRRCFNIESLAVGETEDPNVSNMIIVSSGDGHILEQIEKQLNKKIDVIKVKTFDESESVSRELMLVKVRYSRSNRKDLIEICQDRGDHEDRHARSHKVHGDACADRVTMHSHKMWLRTVAPTE